MSSTKILIWSALGVFATWLLAASGWISCLNMGSVEPLFTGFALSGLIATFVHERQNAREQDKDIAALIGALNGQREIAARASSLRQGYGWRTSYPNRMAASPKSEGSKAVLFDIAAEVTAAYDGPWLVPRPSPTP